MSESSNRREFIKESVVATAAAVAVTRTPAIGATSSRQPVETENGIPVGRLKNLKVSRIFIGCNQVSGYAHGRDLRYLPDLMRSYQTDEKVLDTWELCEETGINMVLSDPFERPVSLMKKYRKERGGKIQWLSEVHPSKPYHECSLADMKENIRVVMDNGPDALYVQGGIGDSFVMRGAVSDLGEVLEDMKATGLPSGIGSHSIETVKALIKNGIEPDFFFKTYHSDNYFSATPKDQRVEFNVDSGSENDHDNIWCIKPDETREVMRQTEIPWIAFKVLAAGALDPREAFRFAFEGGADFICVGMFDFQVPRNVETIRQLLAGDLSRERPWRA
ncbi:MAG: hypothetical protein JSU96_15550 [Acidobacteriota bacterium]|nr:MAG: hypothetical protein JSU96_15550 [Acidobacteriota bacterium]